MKNNISFKKIKEGFPVAEISNSFAKAQISLYGAHLLEYTPAGQDNIIFLSNHAQFEKGKAIRGGIPVCWPWFGDHPFDNTFQTHGFARKTMWDVSETEIDDINQTILKLRLIHNAENDFWPFKCSAEITFTIGKVLTVSLKMQNLDTKEAPYSSALHSYFNVSDITGIIIYGLEGCRYKDKTDDNKEKTQKNEISINKEVDRTYLDTEEECVIEDLTKHRRIHVAKSGSRTTVVWNPWKNKAEQMADLGNEEYRKMVCVETVNAFNDTRILQPEEEYVIETKIWAESL